MKGSILIYVGQHTQVGTSAFDGYLGSGTLMLSAIKEFKKENFTREIIEVCPSLSQLGIRETYWIEALSATDRSIGYNLMRGGVGQGMASEEVRRKMSEAHKGKPTWIKGKHHSEETKRKMKGRKLSEETKENMSRSRKGKPKSEEYKRKMKGNKHALGMKHSNESKIKMSKRNTGENNCKNKYQYTLSNGEDFWKFYDKRNRLNICHSFYRLKTNVIDWHGVIITQKVKDGCIEVKSQNAKEVTGIYKINGINEMKERR